MNSKEFKELEENIYKDPSNKEYTLPIYKTLFVSSVVYLSIFSVLMIASLCLIKTVNLLSIISPAWFYTFAILFIIYIIASIIISTVFKGKMKPFIILLYYKIYDTLAFTLGLVIGISFLIMFILTPTTVVGNSMNDTLSNGDKVLVMHLGYTPQREDVVVIHMSAKYSRSEALYIKRVVAKEGDTLRFADGNMMLGDKIIEKNMSILSFQSAIKLPGGEAPNVTEFVVPKGYSLVLGDHRSDSDDSRNFGLVDNKDILGHAVFSVIPFKKIPAKKLSYK